MTDGTESEPSGKTEGDIYVERYYHPHPELPEEMPEQIIDLLKDADSFDDQNSPLVYELIRNGIGNVLFPGPYWDDYARYIAGFLEGKSIDPPPGSPGNSGADVFRGMFYKTNGYVAKDIDGIKYGRERVSSRLARIAPEVAIEQFKEFINLSPEIIKRCQELVELSDRHYFEKIKDLSDEEKSKYYEKLEVSKKEARASVKRIHELNLESGNDEELNSQFDELISSATNYGQLIGIPTYIAINSLIGGYLYPRDYQILSQRLGLNETDAEIFRSGSDENNIEELGRIREGDYEFFMKRNR